MSFYKIIVTTVIFILVQGQCAFAASRVAEVNSTSTSLFSKPKKNGSILQELHNGDQLKIGTKTVKGWVKGFVIQDGKKASSVGYIQVKDLEILENSPEKSNKKSSKKDSEDDDKDDDDKYERASKREVQKNKKYYLGFLIPLTFHSLKPLEEYLSLSDAGVSKMEMGFAGEFGYQVLNKLWAQLRIEYLKTTQTFDASATGGSSLASYSFSSLFLSVSPEFQLPVSPFLQFDLGLGLGGFFNSTVTLNKTGKASSTASSIVFALVPKATFRVNFTKAFSIGVGGGYRYALETESQNVSTLTYLGLSAPYVDIGLRFRF